MKKTFISLSITIGLSVLMSGCAFTLKDQEDDILNYHTYKIDEPSRGEGYSGIENSALDRYYATNNLSSDGAEQHQERTKVKRRNNGSIGGIIISYEELRYPDMSYPGGEVVDEHYRNKRMLKISVRTYDGETITITQPQLVPGQWFYVGQTVRFDELEGRLIVVKTNK